MLLGAGVNVAASSEAGLPRCRADAGGLTQVLLNLAANARDALPKHNAIVRIETAHIADCVTLRFTDNGHGMDLETQAHIFEPFYTTKGERGTGSRR